MYKPVSQRQKTSYIPIKDRIPFDATNKGIALNTIKGVSKAAVDVYKPLFQPTIDLAKKVINPFVQLAKNPKAYIKQRIEEDKQLALENSKLPVKEQLRKQQEFIESGAIGFSGGLKLVNGITDDVANFLAKEMNAIKIEQKLTKMGVEAEHAKGISPLLAKAKNVKEVKQTLVNFGVPEKKPLEEIFALKGKVKKAPIKVYHGTDAISAENITKEGFDITKKVSREWTGEGLSKKGISFSMNPERAKEFTMGGPAFGKPGMVEAEIDPSANIVDWGEFNKLSEQIGEEKALKQLKVDGLIDNSEGSEEILMLNLDKVKPKNVNKPVQAGEYQIFDANKISQTKIPEVKKSLLPTVIQGETFTMGPSTTTSPTIKGLKTELKATQKEIKNSQIANEKAMKLEAKEQKIRIDALAKLNRYRGSTETIKSELKNKNLSEEDIDNIILEDGTKLTDAAKVKRNNDGSLSTVITRQELDDIAKNYTEDIPKQKWEKKSMLVNAKEIPLNLLKSIELPYAFFERKGLSSIYDQVIDAQRGSEMMKNNFIKKFKEAGLYKDGSWFTANRFDISDNEAKGISNYYLGRQGHGKEIPVTDLSPKSQEFVRVFDEIISETTKPFYEVAKKMGKEPGVVENYAPIMTKEDIKLVDQGGGVDWLFRKHPAFFSLKERVKNAPKDIYEQDYRKVATRWLDGITQFINMGDTTNHLKYLTNSDEFQKLIKEQDLTIINNWLKDITTPKSPSTMAGSGLNELSRLLRRGVALGSLGLNYATVLKQALTQIPISIIEKAPPKLKSEYAKAFGINVRDLPSISKRTGDIAISDLQGKIGSIFTGAITQFDKKNAQLAINALLDKEYNKFLKQGAEITPDIRKIIEKNAQDKIDMWFGGFFKGQRPEAYREEIGNFILMFTYPLTSQANGFFRHMLKAKGFKGNIKAVAEVLAAVVGIAYMEQVIENLTPQWNNPEEMIKDILISLTGNIPMVGQIAYAINTESDMNISPVIGNINNIVRNIGKGEGEKVAWTISETIGLPKQVRRIKEGMDIVEEGGITDSNGKMLAPVQDTMEYIRAFLRGKYGPLASQDYIRNVGKSKDERRWFVPEVEFLQNGDYDRKAELYKSFDKGTQKELRDFLSDGQQEKLDKALKGEKTTKSKSLSDIFK